MIRVATQQDIARLEHDLLARFPDQLLQLIASHPGCRERQLDAWICSWLPLAPEIMDVRRWVSQSIDWFLSNGDIQKEPGGRYTCVPAYAAGAAEDHIGYARVYGDPSVEAWLRRHDVLIQRRPRYAESDVNTGPATGLERTLQVNEQQRDTLKKLGFRFISGNELEEILPRIDLLEEPDLSLAQDSALSSGVWQSYNPRHPGVEGWQDWRYGGKSLSPLVRWLPGLDWQLVREARYFFCYYGSQLIPLSYQQAVLWQFKLEAEYQARSVVWQEDERYLWLPLGLPSIFWQWLNLLAIQPAERIGNRYRLQLERSTIARVKHVLQEHLRLRWSTCT